MADWTPQSRAEEILFKTINGEPYDGLPQSRIEELLLELKEVIEEGGGGGGAYTTTVLFTNGASGDTTFQLSSAYTNFDAIAIYYSHFDGQDTYEDVRTYPTTFLNSVSSTDEVLGITNDVWYYYFSVYSTTEFRYVKSNAGFITDIIGIKYGSSSGGGGTDNYNSLKNLPQINGQTVKGNMSGTSLGLVNMVMGKDLSTNDYTNADKAIVDSVTTDLADKVDKVTGKGLSTNDYDDTAKGIVDGVTSALAGKADVASVPTKTSDLTNDSGFVTTLVNNLLNYYLKSETYSKAEVDTLIAAIATLDIQAVNTLPTTNISTTTIYLVPKQSLSSQDVKDEYINLDGTTSGWELIGNTQIDLSNYVTTSDLTTALQSYATKAYVDGLTFVGTQAQWNALTTEQKKAYKFADITDDYDDNPVGNLNVLTTTDKSSAVGAINELNGKIGDFIDISSNVTVDSHITLTNNNLTLQKIGKMVFVDNIPYSPIVNSQSIQVFKQASKDAFILSISRNSGTNTCYITTLDTIPTSTSVRSVLPIAVGN